jgi:FkbM family methyltransferase
MMRVGVVVPNYNGRAFLKECIDSILAQKYAGLSCLVMDGGSSDGSVELLRAYGPRIQVVSERDSGQADAIQRGFSRLDTDLVGWLNSDDVLLPGAVQDIVLAAEQHPDGVLFHGDVELIDATGAHLADSRAAPVDYERMRRGQGKTLQPGSFYRRGAVESAGGVDPSFHLLMDVDLWIRLLALGPAVRLNRTLAQFRVHPAAKSSQAPYAYYRETLRLGFKHESDRLVRASLRRGLRIAGFHLTHMLGFSQPTDRHRAIIARRVLQDIWFHPNNSGRRVGALTRFAAWQAYKRLTRRPLTLEMYPNVRVRCHPDSSKIAAQIYHHGFSDYAEMSFVKRYLRPGDRFVDVGANEGIYSLLVASLVSAEGEVEAFEPVPTPAARLSENIALNEFSHVHVHVRAVGEEPGSVRIFAKGGTENSIANEDGEVPVTTLDAVLVKDFALGKLAMKGAELLALRGGRRSLAAANPPVWILELNRLCERFGFRCDDVASNLRAADFELYRYEPESGELRTSREPWKESPNIIAIANSRFHDVTDRLRSMAR